MGVRIPGRMIDMALRANLLSSVISPAQRIETSSLLDNPVHGILEDASHDYCSRSQRPGVLGVRGGLYQMVVESVRVWGGEAGGQWPRVYETCADACGSLMYSDETALDSENKFHQPSDAG